MKKGLMLLLCVLLALALPAAALADMRRGDRGDDVYELQQLLWKCGWIFEEPDGVFGAHTEEALKKYQRYSGLVADGVATDEVMAQLRYDYAELFGLSLPTDVPAAPESCVTSEDGPTLCRDHAWVEAAAYDMIYDQRPDYEAAARLWVEAVEELYAEQLAASADEDKLDVLAAFGSWKAEEQSRRAQAERLSSGNKAAAAEQMALWYRDEVAALCEAIHMTGE